MLKGLLSRAFHSYFMMSLYYLLMYKKHFIIIKIHKEINENQPEENNIKNFLNELRKINSIAMFHVTTEAQSNQTL